MRDWLRWKIAHFIDRHYRDICWAKLIWWVNDRNPWRELLDLRHTAGSCARHNETPYCYKCSRTGLHQKLGGPATWEEADSRGPRVQSILKVDLVLKDADMTLPLDDHGLPLPGREL